MELNHPDYDYLQGYNSFSPQKQWDSPQKQREDLRFPRPIQCTPMVLKWPLSHSAGFYLETEEYGDQLAAFSDQKQTWQGPPTQLKTGSQGPSNPPLFSERPVPEFIKDEHEEIRSELLLQNSLHKIDSTPLLTENSYDDIMDTESNTEEVKAYISKMTSATSPQERLAWTKALVSRIRIDDRFGEYYNADTVAAISKALLQVGLDKTRPNTEIWEYIISPEVCQVVQSMITRSVIASDVLRGMTEAVQEVIQEKEVRIAVVHHGLSHRWWMSEELGLEYIGTWGVKLANKWFVRPDHTVCPTSPGFVLALFEYIKLCAEMQENFCDIFDADMDTMDDLILPLVKSILNRETEKSINRESKKGNTALHYASSVYLLPQLTAAILSHPEIDVNLKNKMGQTALILLVTDQPSLSGDPFPTVQTLLAHPGLDVSVVDNDNKTALDRCLDHLGGSPRTVTRALELLRQISQHPSCTSTMIQRALERLVHREVPSWLQDLYTEVVTELASNTKYDINTIIRYGMTLAHIVSFKEHGDLLLKVMDIAGFDPNVEDYIGNTLLYSVCENLPRSQALDVIDHPSVTWDFSHKNCVGQTVLDYYRQLPWSKRNPIVMGRLEQRLGVCATPWEGKQANQQDILRKGSFLGFSLKPIQWTRFIPSHPAEVVIRPTTDEFVWEKAKMLMTHKVYQMQKATKGRCCIISVPSFEVPWLKDLPGYNTDSQRLGELWSGLGFDVAMARCQEDRCLSAQEMFNAVAQFSQSLIETDQCAVLCVLSHGGDGYIYGSDGNKAHVDKLLRPLDNENCPTMAGKPKVVVIQACAGTRNDVSVTATTAPATQATQTELNLLTMSDFIVCSPSLYGLAPCVYETPGRGSVFIEKFVEVFRQHAKEDDINTLMTWVNREVSKKRTLVASQATKPEYYRQMYKCNSCLTKLLYFFPCPGGRQGQDWQLF